MAHMFLNSPMSHDNNLSYCNVLHFTPRSLPLRDVLQRGTFSTQRQKFHTDDINQCFHNKSGSHRVPNANLFNFTFLLVDFGKVLCLSANELQQKSNATSREYYIPQINIDCFVKDSSCLHLTFVVFVFCPSFVNNS